MLGRLIPRVCRYRVCQPRWLSSKRNVPMFCHRREPWNWDAIRHENYFGKPLETHFRDVAKMVDRFVNRPFCEENYVRPKEAAKAWLKSEIAEVSPIFKRSILKSERVSHCCFTPTQQLFSYFMARTS